jgi:hypothetical protein
MCHHAWPSVCFLNSPIKLKYIKIKLSFPQLCTSLNPAGFVEFFGKIKTEMSFQESNLKAEAV